MLRYYRRTITYINHPGTVRVTISEYNGALATTTCTQRDNTRTYTIHYTHVCPRRTRSYMHMYMYIYTHRTNMYKYSFVSLGIRMTMVMRPLPEGFSAHNAIPLVTDNGLCNCSLPMASPFLHLPIFFYVSISVIFTVAPDPFLVT